MNQFAIMSKISTDLSAWPKAFNFQEFDNFVLQQRRYDLKEKEKAGASAQKTLL